MTCVLPASLSTILVSVLQVRFSFDEPDFAMIDTLFSLAEAHLFMQLVELQDSRPDLLPHGKAYPDLYRYGAPLQLLTVPMSRSARVAVQILHP